MADEINIKTGKENMDLNFIHHYLANESYWAKDIPRDRVEQSLQNSYCVGAFIGEEQVGFGRVITDYYTMGWFADFFISPANRGKGISKKILAHIFQEPWLKKLRRIMLATRDAHGLYRQYGFDALSNPDIIMEIYSPDVYLQKDDH